MKYDLKKSLDVPLTPYEQKIEDATDATAPSADTDSNLIAEATMGLREMGITLRGGARPGAGRKRRPHIRTTVLLDPALRHKLDQMAKTQGSMSAVVERLIRSA